MEEPACDDVTVADVVACDDVTAVSVSESDDADWLDDVSDDVDEELPLSCRFSSFSPPPSSSSSSSSSSVSSCDDDEDDFLTVSTL